jgi:SAM-dependent methyltransferase
VGAEVQKTNPAYAGQASYTRGLLRIYDTITYGFNFPVLWRCPRSKLLELYNGLVSLRHLDVGVATGSLLDDCDFPGGEPRIVLMDLNANSLEQAARRLERYAPTTHRANVLEPWGLSGAPYDSVAMTNLLHCVPGDMSAKVVAFAHARAVLAPGGVLFGATVLGKGVRHTRLSRGALRTMNRRGIFSNLDDSLEDLDAGLGRTFGSHEIEVLGAVALFSARI